MPTLFLHCAVLAVRGVGRGVFLFVRARASRVPAMSQGATVLKNFAEWDGEGEASGAEEDFGNFLDSKDRDG